MVEERRPTRAEEWCDAAADACTRSTTEAAADLGVRAAGAYAVVAVDPGNGEDLEAVASLETISERAIPDSEGAAATRALIDTMIVTLLRTFLATHHGLGLTAAIGELERGNTPENLSSALGAIARAHRSTYEARR